MSTSPSHLKRFLGDPAEHLSGYGVFYGDERMENGDPLPTGTLRQGANSSTASLPPPQDFGKSYQVKTGIPLSSLPSAPGNSDTLLGPNGSQTSPADGQLGGTAFQYSTGTYVSQSGSDWAHSQHLKPLSLTASSLHQGSPLPSIRHGPRNTETSTGVRR